MRALKPLLALGAAGLLGACAYVPPTSPITTLPVYQQKTTAEKMLNELPPPDRPLPVAVYGFADQSGQFKLTTTGQNLSRAVSQGGGAMLIRSLQAAGQRKWFTIIEREQLKDLLNERQIIREMRAQYLGEKSPNPAALPALLFAGVILEGGVISYDTNTLTGGLGATLLGIGGTAKYQQDTVTVYLRAVSVKTGEVLASVTTSKTVTAYALDANVFKYISSDSILETENGYTTNEPEQIVLQQAIDKAVYGLILEGVDLKLWNFADPTAGWPFVWRYQQERDGRISPAQAIALDRADARRRGRTPPPAATEVPPPPPPPASTSENRTRLRELTRAPVDPKPVAVAAVTPAPDGLVQGSPAPAPAAAPAPAPVVAAAASKATVQAEAAAPSTGAAPATSLNTMAVAATTKPPAQADAPASPTHATATAPAPVPMAVVADTKSIVQPGAAGPPSGPAPKSTLTPAG